MRIEWEPKWRFSGWPVVGDYIQVKWVKDDDTEAGVSQGMVIRIDENLTIYLDDGDMRQDLVAECWRKGILPESQTREVAREEAL